MLKHQGESCTKQWNTPGIFGWEGNSTEGNEENEGGNSFGGS